MKNLLFVNLPDKCQLNCEGCDLPESEDGACAGITPLEALPVIGTVQRWPDGKEYTPFKLFAVEDKKI